MSVLEAQDVTREHRLGGVCVVINEQHLTSEVSINVAVRAAPAYEGALLGSGISVLLQRLKISSVEDDVRDVLQRSGSRLRHEMHHSYSSYHVTTTREHVAEAIEALARILANTSYDQAALTLERQRLLAVQEMRNDDVSLHIAQMLQGAFNRSDIWRLPVHGMAAELRKLTVQDLHTYDALRYRRGHVTVVVSGNIATENISQAVAKSFQQLAIGFVAEELPGENKEQLAPRILKGTAHVSAPEVVVAWRTTVMEHNDQAILDVIAAYLNAPQSPLRQALEDAQFADALQVHNRVLDNVPGYLEIRYRLRGDNRGAAMHALKGVLRQLQKKGISTTELDAINLRLRRQTAQLENNAQHTARDLLRWEMSVAAPTYGAELRRQYARVSSDHVRQAAYQYLSAERICVISLQAPEQKMEGSQTEGVKNNPEVIVQRPITSVPPRMQQLRNGIHVIERQLPMDLVYVTLSIGGGSGSDGERLLGVNELLARCMSVQTQTRTAEDLQHLLSKNGMTLEARNGEHALQLSITCFPKDTLLAIGVLSDCIARPRFEDADIDTARQNILEELRFRQSDVTWQSSLRRHLRGMMFSDHYAGQNVLGLRQTLTDIDSKMLRDHLSGQVRGGNMVLSIYGSYDRKKIKKFLQRHLANALFFPVGPRQQPFGADWGDATARTTSIKGDVHAIACAWPAPAIDDPLEDQVAMDVLLAMLTGANGRGGRLAATRRTSIVDPFIELEQYSERYHNRGMWNIQAQVHPDTIAVARDLIKQTLAMCIKDLLVDEISPALEEEIAIAQSLCKTIHTLKDADQGQANRDHARVFLEYGSMDPVLIYNKKLQALRREDLVTVAQKFMSGEPFVVQMAPEQAVVEDVQKLLDSADSKKIDGKK